MAKYVDHEQRRRAIVRVFWQIVEQEGTEAISLRRIARETGWSLGATRHYFPQPDDLWVFAAQEMVADSLGRLAQFEGKPAGLARAQDMIEAVLPLDTRRRAEAAVWLEVVAGSRHSEKLHACLTEIDQLVFAGVQEILAELQESGAVHPDRSLRVEAVRCHAMIDGLALHALPDPPLATREDIRSVITAFLSDLAHPPGY